MHRKLDKVPGEMCAAADENLWFRNIRRVRVRISGLHKGGRGCIGCSGRVGGGVKRER